jgi:hypothetical protein
LNFIMPRLPDDFDTFGEYVAMELRSLGSEMYRKMLKREIRQSVARIAELDDLNSLAICSTKITEALSSDPESEWNQCLCQQLLSIQIIY